MGPSKPKGEPQTPAEIRAEIAYLRECLKAGGNGTLADAIRDRIERLEKRLK